MMCSFYTKREDRLRGVKEKELKEKYKMFLILGNFVAPPFLLLLLAKN